MNVAIVDLYLKKEDNNTLENSICLSNLQAGTMLCVKNDSLWGSKSAKILDMVKQSMKNHKQFTYITVIEHVWRKWRMTSDETNLMKFCDALGLTKSINSIIGILSLLVEFSSITEKKDNQEYITKTALKVYEEFKTSLQEDRACIWMFLLDMLGLQRSHF